MRSAQDDGFAQFLIPREAILSLILPGAFASGASPEGLLGRVALNPGPNAVCLTP